MFRKVQDFYYSLKFRKQTYAQCGEDIIIKHFFDKIGVLKPSYLDIGCHHPYFLSNTYLFYKNGSRGINIDPSPIAIKPFNIFRPGDINLQKAISNQNAVLPFYEMEYKTLSTLSEKEAKRFESEGIKITSVTSVQTITVLDLLAKHFNGIFPDFLTIDVEGYEYEIFNSIDFSITFPKLICVETLIYSKNNETKNEILHTLIISKGYHIYAETHINTIYVHNSL